MEEKAITAIRAIVIISSIFTLVAVFVIAYLLYFNKRKASLLEEKRLMQEDFQRQLLQSKVEVQETTFQHIARELHDNVSQLLSTTKMLLGITELNLAQVPETLTSANSTLGIAIQEIRSLSRSLDKEWLEQFSFIDNLHGEVERINTGGIVNASCECDVVINMQAGEQTVLFRIVQEAIQNALRHAKPTQLSIRLSEQGQWLQVVVADNGIGYTGEIRGMGTTNMRHRTQLFGGTISWQPAVPSGTTVTIRIPYKNDL